MKTKTTNKQNRAKRTLAAILASLSLATAVVPNIACTNASAAEMGVVAEAVDHEESNAVNEFLMKQAKTQGLKFLDKGLDALFAYFPMAAGLKPLVKSQILDALGFAAEKEITTKELSEKLDKLEETFMNAMDEQTKTLIDSMEKAFSVGTYKNDLKNLATTFDISQIIQGDEEIHKKYNLTEEEKLVKLAMVVGNSSFWTVDGNFIKQYKQVTSDMLGKNYLDDRDIFTALYDANKHNYKFSGEVIDEINPYITKMVMDYISYTTLALASLSAQEMLISKDFNVDNIKDANIYEQYKSLKNDAGTIEQMKINIARNVFGSDAFIDNGLLSKKAKKDDAFDTVFDHYQKYSEMSRLIFVDTGVDFDSDVPVFCYYNLIGNSKKETTSFGCNETASTTAKKYEDRMTGKTDNRGIFNSLSPDQMEKLAAHIKKQIAAKKCSSVADYLRKVGFKVNSDSAVLLTGNGYEQKNHGVSFCGSDFDSYVKAIKTNGDVQSVRWKHTENYVWIIDAISGDDMRMGDFYEFMCLRSKADAAKYKV